MLISFVMPTYNQGIFIEQSIRSILLQNFPDFELRIHDACSEDNTSDVLNRYIDDDRIKWIREPDEGQVDALNRGLDETRGEILAWLNSDDVLLPEALLNVSQVFLKNPDIDFVYGDALEIGYNGDVYYPNVFTEAPIAERYWFSHNFICQPTCFFRREVWESAKPLRMDSAWTFDYTFFASFFSQGFKGFRLEQFLAANRQYPETKTNQGLLKRYLEQMRMIISRKGMFPWQRKALYIYSLEAIIKSMESWNTQDDLFLQRISQSLLPKLHEWFLDLVNPKEREAIVSRFQAWQSTEGWANIGQWLGGSDSNN